jgi:hypothetical protein
MNSCKVLIAVIGSLLAVSFLPAVHAEQDYFKCKRISRWEDCITVPMASAAEDKAAKLFQSPESEFARLYIARPYTLEPKEKSEVLVDGKLVGLLGPLTYLVFDVPAGGHEVRIRTRDEAVIHLDMQPRQTFYLEYALTLWLGTITSETTVLEKDKGKEKILPLRRAASIPSPR